MTRSDQPRLKLAQVRFVSTAIEPLAAFYAAVADSLKMLAGSVDNLTGMLNAGHRENRHDIKALTDEIRALKEKLDKSA